MIVNYDEYNALLESYEAMKEEEEETVYCYDCDAIIVDDNDSGIESDYGQPVCIACTTECRGCGDTIRIIEMEPLFDYDNRDYCPACHERWQECEDTARDQLMEQLVELQQELFERGNVN